MEDFVVEEYHHKLFDALERVERGELKRLMVFMPPRSSKSEVISKRFPAWCLGRNPKHGIVVTSYAETLATEFGRKARQIVQSPEYSNVFPKLKLADDKSQAGNWETKQGGGYYSVGIGGGLTGRGFNIGIIDDPIKNREEAESQVFRDKVWEWYTSTFFTRRQGSDSAIVILMTRWNTDDLAGRILDLEPNQWEVISFPAFDKEGNALSNRQGFGFSFYNEQRNTIGIRDFEALYQQDPIRSSGQVFKKEDFTYFALSDLNPQDYTFAVHCDPAWSTRQSSDDLAVAVVARNKATKELYALDIFSDPILPTDAYSYMLTAKTRWSSLGYQFEFFSIEDVKLSKGQTLFVEGFYKYLKDKSQISTILTFDPVGKGKKEDRIKYSLEPYFNRKAIHFRCDDTGNKSWQKLETQLLKFPNNMHDDLIDVLGQGVSMWESRTNLSSEHEKESIDAPEQYLNTLIEKKQRATVRPY